MLSNLLCLRSPSHVFPLQDSWCLMHMHNFEWFYDKHSLTARIEKNNFCTNGTFVRKITQNICTIRKNVQKKRFFAVFHKKMKSGDPVLILDSKSMDRIHFVTMNGTNQKCRHWSISYRKKLE